MRKSVQRYQWLENLICGIPTLNVGLKLKENIQTAILIRVHRVKRTSVLAYVDMDAHAGNSCAGTVVTTRAAKITTFAVVTVFTVHRASCRFRISGFPVTSHMNADDRTCNSLINYKYYSVF